MSKTYFAIDLGNKQTKLASDKESYRLPSYYAIKDDNSLSSFNANSDSDFDVHVFETSDGKQYLWGNDLDKIVSDEEIKDTIKVDEGRYNDQDFQNVTEFALALMALDYVDEVDDTQHINVVTGLPTSDFELDDAVKAMKSAMKKHVMLKVDGTPVDVQVDKVLVMPQPIGSIFDLRNSENRNEISTENIVLADLGGGTLLIDTFRNLNYNVQATVQKTQGAYELYNKINRAIKVSPRPNIHTIEKIVREGSEKGKYVYHARKGKTIDLTDIVKEQIANYTEGVISSIKHSVMNENEIDEVIFTGGGSKIIDKNLVEDSFENVSFTKHGEMSNVFGFLQAGKANK